MSDDRVLKLEAKIVQLQKEKETILGNIAGLVGEACPAHTEQIIQMSFGEFVEFDEGHCKYCLRDALKEIADTKRVSPDPSGYLAHMVVTYCAKVDYLISLAKEALEGKGEHETETTISHE